MALIRATAIAAAASIASNGAAYAQAQAPADMDAMGRLWAELAQGDRLALVAAGIVASVCVLGGGVRFARYVRRRAPEWRPRLRRRPRAEPAAPPSSTSPSPSPAPQPPEAPAAEAPPSRDQRRRLALEVGQAMQGGRKDDRPKIACAGGAAHRASPPQPLSHAQAALTARIAAIGRRETEARRAKERAAASVAADTRGDAAD